MNTINAPIFVEEKCALTIALIDENRVLSGQISDRLRNAGCTVIQGYGSADIASIIQQKPDFIVIDPVYDTCNETKLCDYLQTPGAAGVVVFSSDRDFERRNALFECGILEYFSKDETPEYLVEELLRLFETIINNSIHHVTLISSSSSEQADFRRRLLHRHYQLSFILHAIEARNKWNQTEHTLPDLLVLDLADENHLDELLDLIRFIRFIKVSEVPIIVFLDRPDPNLSSKLFRAGVNDVLTRPFRSEELLWSITHHLDYRISQKRLKYEQSLSSQLKAMIDSSSIVSKTDIKGVITYVNDPLCVISGYTREELIGKPHSIIRHPDNPPELFKQMWETIRNKQMYHGIIKNLRKDGSTYYVDSTVAPILDDTDTIIEYISIRNDVTPLIEKQHEIEEQRRRIQNVLDAQTSLICMVDKSRGVVQANLGFMEFLGIKSLHPNVCGFHHLYELFLDTDGTFHIRNGERYVWLERLYGLRGKLVKVAMKDRFFNHHIFSIHVEKIPDQHFSEGICYLVSFEDITELNRALREAQLSSEAESRFLATMSHEIRTPLNGILGFTELLKESALNDEQKKYLQAIEYSGETLRQIINDILEVMKLERGELELHLEPVNLIGELEAILYPFYAHAAKKGVIFLVFIDPKLPVTVQADLLRLKQILINLIGNAVKFTSKGKCVCVRVKKIMDDTDHVTVGFTVADEGIGVKPEQKEAIFNAFVQADNSIAREFGGTGLGLNIVMRVISAMGSKISFKSDLGKGSVFHTKLRFACEAASYGYRCRKESTYLYLPVKNPPNRFKLLEHYLKRFACCIRNVHRISDVNLIEDTPDTAVVLFMEMMSTAQIAEFSRRFRHAKLYILPASQATPFLPLHSANVVWIPYDLSWSNIVKTFKIYDPDTHKDISQEESPYFRGIRILVAEDNDVNRFLIEEFLKKLGIEAEMAHDGYEAVKKFMTGTFDMVLMDINMPNLDGISATGQIIRFEQEIGRVHTPIIGLSADAVAKNITRYIQKGLDGYLIKPLKKSDLVALFKEFLGHAESFSPTELLMQEEKIDPSEETGESLSTAVASKLELPRAIVLELFRKFISNATLLIEQIRSHPAPPELKMGIHSLKGIAKNLYLEPLGSSCERFETDLAVLNETDRLGHVETICKETETIIRRMQEELQP